MAEDTRVLVPRLPKAGVDLFSTFFTLYFLIYFYCNKTLEFDNIDQLLLLLLVQIK